MGILLNTAEPPFDRALHQLMRSSREQKKYFQEPVLIEAAILKREKSGLELLYKHAPDFEAAGLFLGRSWDEVKTLRPELARGTLASGGNMAAAETLSILRVLAVARGMYIHPDLSSKEANDYLRRLLALNLDLLTMRETEENRLYLIYKEEQEALLIRFIAEHCFSPEIFTILDAEVKNLVEQRPIVVSKVTSIVESSKKLTGSNLSPYPSIYACEQSLFYPSELAKSQGDYVDKLKNASDFFLLREAVQLRNSMLETGLVSVFQAIFLQYISSEKHYLLEVFFGTDSCVREVVRRNFSLIRRLIKTAIRIKTRQSIYGLYRMLERDVFTAEVITELEQFLKLQADEVQSAGFIRNSAFDPADLNQDSTLAGIISLLGQPLGVAQGFNPTCQATRLLSYLAQKYPQELIRMVTDLRNNGGIVIEFEGQPISSLELVRQELEDRVHIDEISAALLPHLDAIYNEIFKRSILRGTSPHKWLNPAFHLAGVLEGFAERKQESGFSALFYMFYHPDAGSIINGELPQPADITIYSRNGRPLGIHSILIQRIAVDPSGNVRVYYYNPNNNSHQHWKDGIMTSVSGNGELEGEASVTFDDFLLCLNAFHYPAEK
ncbi:MAG TPA: hypothetical protein DCR24_09880 [Bacillus bacterium]|nr:hypothetical protein [Bacillus sp. (in: firmicutes)]